MTPINAAASGLPYRAGPESGAVGMAPYTAPTSGDAYAAAYEQSIDPSVGGFVDSDAPLGARYDTGYDSAPVDAQPNVMGVPVDAGSSMQSSAMRDTGGYEATIADIAETGVFTESELQTLASYGYSPQQLGSIHESAVNSLYGSQQAQPPYSASDVQGPRSAQPVAAPATIEQIAELGVYTQEELQQLYAANFSPQELGEVYEATIQYIRSPEFAQLQSQQQAQLASQGVDGAAAPAGEPAWSSDWNKRFQDAFKEQGLDSKTRMMVIGSLKQMGLGEADLQQAFEYYTANEAGLVELQAANDQVRAGVATQDKMMLAMGGLALAGGAATTAVAASRGNLTRVLTRVASDGADEGARAAARAALEVVKEGRALPPSVQRAANLAVRDMASETNRLLHPLRKASLNGATRALNPSVRLSFGDSMRYGLMMKHSDAAADAVRGASSVSRAAAAGAVDDVAKAAGGAVDDVAKVAVGAVDDVAKGASMLSKAGKFLGPIGIVASAGFGLWGISKTMDAEGGFGEESAKMTGNVVGGLGGAVAGAAAGAAIGTAVPVIGNIVGGLVGGIVGGIGLGKIGEGIGGMLHGLFD
jgi:hypothetical protein